MQFNDSDKEKAEALSELIGKAKSQLQSGQFQNALVTSQSILDIAPEHLEALYIKAVSERYGNHLDEALETLKCLKSSYPEYGRAFQEEGHNYLAKGEVERALKSYQQACTLNPGLEASWKAQSDILGKLGHHAQARSAMGFYQRLTSLPRDLHTATNLLHEGKLMKAEQVCKRYLLKDKTNIILCCSQFWPSKILMLDIMTKLWSYLIRS